MCSEKTGIFMLYILLRAVVIKIVIIRREWHGPKPCWASGKNIRKIRYWLIMPTGNVPGMVRL